MTAEFVGDVLGTVAMWGGALALVWFLGRDRRKGIEL